MIKKKDKNTGPSQNLNSQSNNSVKTVYETAQTLTPREKVQLISQLIETSDLSLSLKVEITGSSSKTTVLRFSADPREDAAQSIEDAAIQLTNKTTKKSA